MRLGKASFGEGVHEALVFLAMAEFRRHPKLIQSAAAERDRGAQPRQADKAHRLKPDAVEYAGDVVGPVARFQLAEAFGKGEREAAAGAEPLDRGTEFLRLAGPDAVAAQPGDDAFDAGVEAATVQRVHHVAQVVAPAEQGIRQPALRAVLLQRLVQVQVQDDFVGQGLFALPGPPREVSAASCQHHDDKADQREKAREEAEHGVSRKNQTLKGAPRMRCGVYLSIWWYSGLGII